MSSSQGFYFAKSTTSDSEKSRDTMVIQIPLNAGRLRATREAVYRAVQRNFKIVLEEEQGHYECKWASLVRKERKQLRRWLPELFADEEKDINLMSKSDIEAELDKQIADEKNLNKWETFEKIRQGEGFAYVCHQVADFKNEPIFLLVSPFSKEKIPKIKSALYEAINEGMIVMEKNADPVQFCKDPNQMWAFSWTDEVRKNPEELVKHMPNLFPDHPDVIRKKATLEKLRAQYEAQGYQYTQFHIEGDEKEDAFVIKKPIAEENVSAIRRALHMAISKNLRIGIEVKDGSIEECDWVQTVRMTPALLKNYMPELFPESQESKEKSEEEKVTSEVSKLTLTK